MALRSLGSSLVAKATPGSVTRDYSEKQISKSAIPGKGDLGTTGRDLVQEPGITPAAPGSAKVISVSPEIKGETRGSGSDNGLIAGSMGLTQNPGQTGSVNPAMFSANPNVVSASAPSSGGRQAVARSGAGQAGDVRATGNISVPGASTSSYEAPQPTYQATAPFLSALLGSKSFAEEPGVVNKTQKNLGQAIVATLSKPGSAGEAWGTSEAVRRSGVGSITNPGATINAVKQAVAPVVQKASSAAGNVVRSISQGVSNAKSTVASKLRSLFGR